MIRLLINDQSGTRVGAVPRWAVWLGVAALAAAGVLVAIIGFSLILILAPVVIVAGAIARWRLKKALREMAAAQAGPFARRPPGSPSNVIDAEYRVIEPAASREPR